MRTLMTIAVLGAGLLAVVPITQGDDRRDEERDDDDDDDDDADTLTLAVYGDAPYGTSPTDDSQLLATPAFIAAINAERDVKAVLHVGDIHSGKQFCIEAYDRAVFDLWRAFERPLIFTPGDNEWTDCHKPGQGGGTFNPTTGQIDFVLDASGNPVDFAGGDPLANLDLVRSLFFPHPGKTLGRHPMRVRSQAHHFDHRHPRDGDFVENVMWEAAGVLFVTINLPGGSNNDTDVWYGAPTPSAAQLAEVFDRSGSGEGRRAPGPVRAVRAEHRVAHTGIQPSRSARQRRFARLPVGQSTLGERPAQQHASRPRRTELPSHRRPRQHDPARVVAPHDRSQRQSAAEPQRVRSIPLGTRHAVTASSCAREPIALSASTGDDYSSSQGSATQLSRARLPCSDRDGERAQLGATGRSSARVRSRTGNGPVDREMPSGR